MFNKISLAALVFLLPVFAARGEQFSFKDYVGDKQRTISTGHEEVLVNGVLSYKSLILNRMTSEVTKAENGVATHRARFTLAEEKENSLTGDKTFRWSKEYDSIWTRGKNGALTVNNQYIMPTVRNVPVFPDKDLKEGDTWQSGGLEAHDLEPTFGLKELFKIPFTANYTFLGNKQWKNKDCKAFSVEYYAEVDVQPLVEWQKGGKNSFFPVKASAKSSQIVYWDSERGRIIGACEEFSLIFTMNNGNVYEFRGNAKGEIIEAERMNKDEIADDVEKALQESGIKDASVTVTDDGINISLENIQFSPDSPQLLPQEKLKLDKIGGILKQYASRDILVSGHAANSGGTEKSRQQLSEERAAAVAGYLITEGVRTRDRILTRGFGSTKPAASNATEEGRRKNRRVEITILEN